MILSICDSGEVLATMRIVKIVVQAIRIIVPIILIVSLILTYVGAMTDKDNNAIAKANKSLVPKLIALAILFFMPYLVNLVGKIAGQEKIWQDCITNATKSGINAAYRQDAEARIAIVKETISEADYNTALSYIRKIEDEETRKSLENELAETKKYIDIKNEINRLKSSYNENDYNSLKSKIDSISDSNVKSRLSSLLEEVKNSNSDPTGSSSAPGVPINVTPSGSIKSYSASTGRTIYYYVGGPTNMVSNLPLIVYLHGDGSVGNPDNLTYGEMTAYVKQVYQENPPFVYLLPYTETTSWTDGNRPQTVIELIDKIASEYQVNKNKIILSGGSRGAMGAWFIANQYASKFSAFMPISGTGNITPSNFRSLPTRAIVSTDGSDSWCYSNMQTNCNNISNIGGRCQFIPMNGYTHNTILGGAFKKENFEWMINQ